MAKIYSRPRIKLPKIKNEVDKAKLRKTITILIILLIAFSVVKRALDATSPIFDTLCENKAKSIATTVSNEQAKEIMKQYTYNDLFTIEKDNNNNVNMIKTNVTNINKITSQLAIDIQQEFDNKGREDIQIALRKFYRLKIIIRERTRCTN